MFQGRVETRLIQKKQAIHTNHRRPPRRRRAAGLGGILAAPRGAVLALFAALFLASPAALAGPAQPPTLDRLFAYYQSLKDFQAAFRQTKTLAAEGLELKSSGTMRVSLGRALLWSVTAPAPLAVFLDGGSLVLQSGAGARATTTRYELKTSSFSEKIAASMKELTALLAMDRAALEGSYTIAADQGALLLTPRLPRQFKQVRMAVAAGAEPWINLVAIDEMSGDRMALSFSKPERLTDTRWTKAWTIPGG